MGMQFGDKAVTGFQINGKNALAAYQGDALVWSAEPVEPPPIPPADLAWAAGSNFGILTDGDSNIHLMELQSIGVGNASASTPELTLPDFEGVWRTQIAGEPPWQGARVVGSGATGVEFFGSDELGDPLPEAPWLYTAPAYTQRNPRSYKLLNWTDQGLSQSQDAVGMNGEFGSASTVTDASTTASAARFMTVAINPNAAQTLRWFIKKDDVQTAWTGLGINGAHGWTGTYILFNKSTGAWNQVAGTFNDVDIRLVGEWWEINIQVTSGSQVAIDQKIWPAMSSDGTLIEDTVTGSVTVGNAEVHQKTIAQIRGAALMQTNGTVPETWAAINLSFSITNHDQTQGMYYAECKYYFSDTDIVSALHLIDVTGGTNMGVMGATSLGRLPRSYDGLNLSEVADPFAAEQVMKVASVYEAGVNKTVNRDGIYAVNGAYDGGFDISSLITLMDGTPGVSLIRNIRRYDLGFVAGKSKIDGLMALGPVTVQND
jgi:hypothetical protein